jgi:hypothetical protein
LAIVPPAAAQNFEFWNNDPFGFNRFHEYLSTLKLHRNLSRNVYFISPNRNFNEPILLWQELQGNNVEGVLAPKNHWPSVVRTIWGDYKSYPRELHGAPFVV